MINRRHALMMATASALSLSVARGQNEPTRLTKQSFKEAKTGDWFVFNNTNVKLVDVIAPEQSSAVGLEARKTLQALLDDANGLSLEIIESDRWQQKLAYLSLQQSTAVEDTVQAILVAKGLCRVRPQSAKYDNIIELMLMEHEARVARKGIWADQGQRRFSPDDFIPFGDYCVVEGEVKEASIRQSRLYLNFGEDWRSDFTVTLAKSVGRRWRLDYDEWSALNGTIVQARGYIDKINGPSIDLIHPLQVVRGGIAPRPLFSFVQATHLAH